MYQTGRDSVTRLAKEPGKKEDYNSVDVKTRLNPKPHILKGPKREIFVAGIFAQIRPIWIGYLGTRPKNPKLLCLGP